MQLSNRILGITGNGSDGWDLFYKARAMKNAGQDVLELTIGDPDVRTSPQILAAMQKSARGGHTGYATIAGVRELRETIAARVTERTGVATSYENIVVTPGGQAGLFAAHNLACDPGDNALFIDPYYATYPGTIRAAGANPVAITARADAGFQPDAKDIAGPAARARSLLINSPNNPTGAVYGSETMNVIGRVCLDNDLWLISDEVYDTQVWTGQHISARALPDMRDRTLVIGSMSKGHAMTGSRIGWLVAPKDAVDRLITLFTHTTYGVPGFIQDAALFALNQGRELESEVAEPFRRRRDIALGLLARQNTVSYVPPEGAMYLMLNISATGMNGDDFASALLSECHVAVMPGESFGNAAQGHVRVAMTLPDDRFQAALSKLLNFAERKSQ